MEVVTKELEQLGREIAAATAKADSAEKAYLSARDARQRAMLKEAWEKKEKKVKELMEDRRALHAKLTGPGDDRLAALEAEAAATKEELTKLKKTQDLAVALRDKVLRYSQSNISRGSNKKLRRRLHTAYGAEQNGLLRDMLTGEMLPATTVIASHLYKSEWRDFAKLDLGLEDIDDVGNGLLLWKPIEHAFDTSALCFVYDKLMDRFVAHVLDTSLLNMKLAERGAKLMGRSWLAPPPGSRAALLTYRDIDGQALSFPPGCLQRPLKRVLCYQAHLAKKEAGKQGWRQLEFDDFWSEGLPYVEKVMAWLHM